LTISQKFQGRRPQVKRKAAPRRPFDRYYIGADANYFFIVSVFIPSFVSPDFIPVVVPDFIFASVAVPVLVVPGFPKAWWEITEPPLANKSRRHLRAAATWRV
jgi:hypothetical protein